MAKTPRKSVSVSKKVSEQQIIDSKRWNEFLKASSVKWDDLSDEWKDFYEAQGNIETASVKLNELIDKAMGGVE